MFGALGFLSAKGMVAVPSVTGQSQSTAQTNLTNANLTFSTTTVQTNTLSNDGKVATQSIAAETLVDYGTEIILGIFSYVALEQLPAPTLFQSRNSSSSATVTVGNYDASNSYSINTNGNGSASFSSGAFTITGIASDAAFSVTVTVSRSGFASNQASITVAEWTSSSTFGGTLSVTGTSSSSVSLSASMWNTTSSSIAWYANTDGESTISSGFVGPFISQSSPQTNTFTASGLSSSTTYDFKLYVNGVLVSTASATTGSPPPPPATWYCTTRYANGGQQQFTATSDQSQLVECVSNTVCSLSGYPSVGPVPC